MLQLLCLTAAWNGFWRDWNRGGEPFQIPTVTFEDKGRQTLLVVRESRAVQKGWWLCDFRFVLFFAFGAAACFR